MSNQEVIRNLYQTHAGRLLNSMTTVVSDRQTAEDITAAAFAKAFENLPQFRGESSLYTWVHAIAQTKPGTGTAGIAGSNRLTGRKGANGANPIVWYRRLNARSAARNYGRPCVESQRYSAAPWWTTSFAVIRSNSSRGVMAFRSEPS